MYNNEVSQATPFNLWALEYIESSGITQHSYAPDYTSTESTPSLDLKAYV